MNGKQAKKLRRYSNKTVNEQVSYIHGSIKPYPRSAILFYIWLFVGRFYFTKEHLSLVKKIRNE